jgi:hypothetical protein
MERLCLEDVGSCNITSAMFCDQKRKFLAVAHVLIAARHAAFYAESNGLPSWTATGCFIAIFGVSLVAEKLQFSLCLIKYYSTLRRVQECKCISHIRQLGPTGWWVVSCTPPDTLPPRKVPPVPFGKKGLAAGLGAVDTESASLPQIEPEVSACSLVTTVSIVTQRQYSV